MDVDTPLGGVQVEGLESTSLASELNGIDVLVTTVVSGTGVTLGVFVGHWGSQGLEDGVGSEVLGGDENDRLALTLDLTLLLTISVSYSSEKIP